MFKIVALVIALHNGQMVPGTFYKPGEYFTVDECEMARTSGAERAASERLAQSLMAQGLRLLPVIQTKCESIDWYA